MVYQHKSSTLQIPELGSGKAHATFFDHAKRSEDFSSDADVGLTPLQTKLLIALFSLASVALICTTILVGLRAYRRRRAYDSLHLPHSIAPDSSSASSSLSIVQLGPKKGSKKHAHRRTLSITTTPARFMNGHRRGASVTITDHGLQASRHQDESYPGEGKNVPEIRITFPEEEDVRRADGKRESRVVVVRLGEGGAIGMEPYVEEQLPTYMEKEGLMARNGEFESLDLERMGGLREKDEKRWV